MRIRRIATSGSLSTKPGMAFKKEPPARHPKLARDLERGDKVLQGALLAGYKAVSKSAQ